MRSAVHGAVCAMRAVRDACGARCVRCAMFRRVFPYPPSTHPDHTLTVGAGGLMRYAAARTLAAALSTPTPIVPIDHLLKRRRDGKGALMQGLVDRLIDMAGAGVDGDGGGRVEALLLLSRIGRVYPTRLVEGGRWDALQPVLTLCFTRWVGVGECVGVCECECECVCGCVGVGVWGWVCGYMAGWVRTWVGGVAGWVRTWVGGVAGSVGRW